MTEFCDEQETINLDRASERSYDCHYRRSLINEAQVDEGAKCVTKKQQRS